MSADQEIEELERQAEVVSRRLGELADLERKMVIDATIEAHARFHSEHGAEVSANKEKRQNLRRDIENLRVAAAKGEESPYPEGMRVVEWKINCRGFRGPQVRSKTGRIGVIEVFTRKSARPANSASYSLPSIGARVVRFLKKDGSPSRLLRSFPGDDLPSGWYPEGVDPNEKGIQQ